jgi:16S rRNA A1518/A1519 N6-dimethyltransferase RsmA/KsgA/DIM1 with predicted DNA glycosylase/AP lyase activity
MDIASFILLLFIFVVVINTIYSTKCDCDGLNIYDCGSGWGGLCSKLSKAFPNAQITGIEISPIPFLVSYLNPFRRYKIKRHDLFRIDLSQADILIFYLSPYHMDMVSHKILSEVQKGTTIYSQGFPIKGWNVSKEMDISLSLEKKLYRYDL